MLIYIQVIMVQNMRLIQNIITELVLVQSLSECGDYDNEDEDGDDNDEDGDVEGDDVDIDNDGEDHDGSDTDIDLDGDENENEGENGKETEESDDGISSDDPNEFDNGYAEFNVGGQAYDKCDGSDDKSINSALIYQSNDNELHIVFDHFQCNLFMDPFIGLDSAKYSQKEAATSINIIIAVIIGIFITLLY